MVFGAVGAAVLARRRHRRTVYVHEAEAAADRQAQQLNVAGRAPVAKGSIEITSDPPGAAIWIDGDLRPEVTPATITQLPTSGRALDVKLTKDGFESREADRSR